MPWHYREPVRFYERYNVTAGVPLKKTLSEKDFLP
jgi:hypothetical protein